MVAKDTLVGVVGAVLLVAALAGIFYFDGSGGASPGLPFDVTWTSHSLTGPNTTGHTDAKATTNLTLDVTPANLTSAVFTLSWTDDVGSPDTFRLVVTSPDGSLQRAVNGSSGSIQVRFDGVNPVPDPTTVQAANLQGARAKLADQASATRGQGAWQVSVTCVKAGGFQPIPGGPVLQQDTGNDWTLRSRLTVYAPHLASG